MPQKDKTGPEGKGPATGRGLGDCTARDLETFKKKVSSNSSIRRGSGRGLGRGAGRGLGRNSNNN